jgi:SAM-dependent methyltransferase
MKIPWQAKVGVQWVLAAVPGGEQLNHLFQRLYGSHSDDRLKARIPAVDQLLDYIERFAPLKGATVVEVGTGWVPIGALCMVKRGAQVVHTYDLTRHLRPKLAERAMQLMEMDPAAWQSVHYHAPADASQTGLPDQSVDLFYSAAVLEHVPPEALVKIVRESRRVLRPGGVAFHEIGLHDHYSDVAPIPKINFLKYSDRTWDFWVQNRISYHNRMRAKEFLQLFEAEGLKILDVQTKTDQYEVAMLKHGFHIDRKFKDMTPEELAINNMRVLYQVNETSNARAESSRLPGDRQLAVKGE